LVSVKVISIKISDFDSADFSAPNLNVTSRYTGEYIPFPNSKILAFPMVNVLFTTAAN